VIPLVGLCKDDDTAKHEVLTPRPIYPRRRNPVSILQKAGWVPGQI
jgi:hypothetical protein